MNTGDLRSFSNIYVKQSSSYVGLVLDVGQVSNKVGKIAYSFCPKQGKRFKDCAVNLHPNIFNVGTYKLMCFF